MNNIFTVYSMKLAGYLMQNGFPLLQIVKNSKTGKNDFHKMVIDSDLLVRKLLEAYHNIPGYSIWQKNKTA